MRTYTFSIGGVRVEMRGSVTEVSLYTFFLVTAFQSLRRERRGARPSPAEIIKKATCLRLGMQMGCMGGKPEGVSNYVH